tara:strand:- start:2576 stop:2770 length:195 start_codon:yes stop_codon:yes gene_type:complete
MSKKPKTEKKVEQRPEFKSYKEWVVLTNEEKVKAYKTLTDKEKKNIWSDEYMKIIPLNIDYPRN